MEWDRFKQDYEVLTRDVSLEGGLFREAVLWALIQERIDFLTPHSPQLKEMMRAKDGLAQYWGQVETKTGRQWDFAAIQVHWERATKSALQHKRQPISFEDKLRLFFTSPRRCRHCGREPPEVELHIDHKEPVALGGDSTIRNLQFLCKKCNLKKGPKLKREDFFDRYLC